MCLSDGSKVPKGDVCDTFADVDLPSGYQIARLFKRHLDVVGGLGGLVAFVIESDVCFVVDPLLVSGLDTLVIEPKILGDYLLDPLRVRSLQPQVEKSTFLSEEPFTELLVTAVG